MSPEVLEIAVFTTIAAVIATAVMLIPGVALAWLLARRAFLHHEGSATSVDEVSG